MFQQAAGGFDRGGVVLAGQQDAAAVADDAQPFAAGAVDIVQSQPGFDRGRSHEN
jgi:hypothetical protein